MRMLRVCFAGREWLRLHQVCGEQAVRDKSPGRVRMWQEVALGAWSGVSPDEVGHHLGCARWIKVVHAR